MGEICTTCGLPKELCVCESIAKESLTIVVKNEKRKFGKNYTVIDGVNTKGIDVEEVAKKLKSKFACGGTIKDGRIELQGDHKSRAKAALTELGFAPETIEVQ